MNDGQVSFGDLRIVPLRNGGVDIAALGKPGVAAPVVGDDGGPRRHRALDEPAKGLCASVRQQGKPGSTGVSSSLAFVEAAAALALTHLDGTGYKRHIVNAASFAARAATNPGFIGFDVNIGTPTNSVLVGTHHSNTEFMKNLESRFVARKPELSLKLNSRNTRRLTSHQVGRPEPYRKRRVSMLHDGASGEVSVVLTDAVPKNGWAIGKSVRFVGSPTARANECATPTRAFEIGRTCRLIREQLLKLG